MNNKLKLISFIWIITLGYIIYNRTTSNTLLLFIAICLSYIILYEKKTKQNIHEFDKDLTYWLNTLINTKTINDRNICYNIIIDKLLTDNLLKNIPKNSHLSLILKQFEPIEPLEYNL